MKVNYLDHLLCASSSYTLGRKKFHFIQEKMTIRLHINCHFIFLFHQKHQPLERSGDIVFSRITSVSGNDVYKRQNANDSLPIVFGLCFGNIRMS